MDVATGKTLTLTSTAGTDYELDVSAIDGVSGGVFTVDGDISVSSETTLKMTAAQATTETVTGAGSVVIQTLDASAADISSVTNTGTVTLDLGDAGTTTLVDGFNFAARAYNVTSTGAQTLNVESLSTNPFDATELGLSGNVTLELNTTQANGLILTGTGAVQIATDASDGTKFVLDGSKTMDVSEFATTLSEIRFEDETGAAATELDIRTGSTLKMTANRASGETISGAGAVEITDLDLKQDADLANVTVTGGLVIDLEATSATLTSAANLGATTLSVVSTGGAATLDVTAVSPAADMAVTSIATGNDVTVTLTAEQANGLTVNGTGDAIITDVALTPAADLDAVTPSAGVTIDLEATLNTSMTAAAKIGAADLTVTSTGGVGTLDLKSVTTANMKATSITINTGATTELTAAQADDLQIDGVGSVNVNANGQSTSFTLKGSADFTLSRLATDVDASAVTDSLTVTTEGSTGLTITAGTDATTVTSLGITAGGEAVTVNAVNAAADKTLTLLGTSNFTVTNLKASLSNTASGLIDVTLADASVGSASSNSISSTQAITINADAAEAADTVTVIGGGHFTVNNLAATLNAASATGAVTATTDADASLSVTLGTGAGGNQTVISSGTGTITVEATNQSASDIVLSGSSTFDVNNVASGVDVDASLTSGLVDIDTDTNATLTVTSGTGATGNTKVTSDGTGTITVNAAQQASNDVVLVGSSAFNVTNVAHGVDVDASSTSDAVGVSTDNLVSGNALTVTAGSGNLTVGTGSSNGGATMTVAAANMATSDTLSLSGGAGFQVNGITVDDLTVAATTNGIVVVDATDLVSTETLNLSGSSTFDVNNVGNGG